MKFEPSAEELTKLANAAFKKSAKRVIQQAAMAGTPIIVWEDGKIRHLTVQEAEQRLKESNGSDVGNFNGEQREVE